MLYSLLLFFLRVVLVMFYVVVSKAAHCQLTILSTHWVALLFMFSCWAFFKGGDWSVLVWWAVATVYIYISIFIFKNTHSLTLLTCASHAPNVLQFYTSQLTTAVLVAHSMTLLMTRVEFDFDLRSEGHNQLPFATSKGRKLKISLVENR